VLIGHGFAGSRQLMHPFAVTLARNGYVAVVFDFPGHGRNPTPLAGKLGEPERAEALLDAFGRVARYARDLPASDGRLATLGHSMAGDILIRYADIDPDIDASIAVSPYLSRELGADGPRDLLFIYGEYEPMMIRDQGREAVAMVAAADPADIELGKTYGDLASGDARAMVIADGVEHIGVLYSATSLHAALDWLNQVYGLAMAKAVPRPGYRREAGSAPTALTALSMPAAPGSACSLPASCCWPGR
jgi:dienelactone hydrolase